MRILFIGDIFGEKGKQAIQKELPDLIPKENIDLVIANAENCTNGRSLSLKDYEFLKKCRINYFTFGNHTWYLEEIKDVLKNNNTIRPLNIKPLCDESKYGIGSLEFKFKNKKIRITNLLGNTVFCHEIQTNPFLKLDEILNINSSDIHIIDFHAETTSEKNAFLQYFAGKVSAILGTHTHIQSADERIYKNTAYITDAGMTGPSEGVIGANPETIIKMFRGESERFRLSPDTSNYQFNGVVIEFDEKNNKPINIKRIFIREKGV